MQMPAKPSRLAKRKRFARQSLLAGSAAPAPECRGCPQGCAPDVCTRPEAGRSRRKKDEIKRLLLAQDEKRERNQDIFRLLAGAYIVLERENKHKILTKGFKL